MSEADWADLRQALGNQRMLGMSLEAGGHLTHGFRPNISGKMFDQRSYGTDPETGLLDYDALRAQVQEFRPLILVAGYSAYPRKINFRIMREIADEVGATLLVDMAHFAGLVAGKVFTGDFDPVPHAHIVTTTTHKSLRGPRGGMVLCTEEYAPFVDRGCPLVLGGPLSHIMASKAIALSEAAKPEFQDYAQRVVDNAVALADGLLKSGAQIVTGGTENHIVLLDVSPYGLTGRQAESALIDAGLVANRNAIPNDPNGAWFTSGVRFGTPGADHSRIHRGRPARGRHPDRSGTASHHGRHHRLRGAVQGQVHTWTRRCAMRCWPGRPTWSAPTRSIRSSSWPDPPARPPLGRSALSDQLGDDPGGVSRNHIGR